MRKHQILVSRYVYRDTLREMGIKFLENYLDAELEKQGLNVLKFEETKTLSFSRGPRANGHAKNFT